LPFYVIPSLKNGATNGNPLGAWMEHVVNKWKTRKELFVVGGEIWCNFCHTPK
jgi:hypothetical protein